MIIKLFGLMLFTLQYVEKIAMDLTVSFEHFRANVGTLFSSSMLAALQKFLKAASWD